MPRLIAIDGREAGLALPVQGRQVYLTLKGDGRLHLDVRPPRGESGAEIRVDGERYAILSQGGVVTVNGRPVEGSAALHHGDMLTFGGATLIFDCDDHGEDSTNPAPERPVARPVRASAAAAASVTTSRPAAESGRRAPQALGDSVIYRHKVFDTADQAVLTVAGKADGAARRLGTLLKLAAALGGTLDPQLLCTLLDRIFEITPASRGTVLLYDNEAQVLRSFCGKVRPEPAREGVEIPVSSTIVREALRTQDAILTMDAQADVRFQAGESIVAAGIRSALCVPILRDGRVLGAIHLDTFQSGAHFGRQDTELMAAVAVFAALAIENVLLYQDARERERMQTELHLASSIQRGLLPKEAPRATGLSVYGRMRPAKELGGDLFDFIPAEGGSLHAFVGDVSGKGVGASLIMAMARSYLRSLTEQERSPRALIRRLNHLLYQDTDPSKFMSAVHLFWDAEARRLVYCGAGQEHLLIYRARARKCEAVPAGGVALAVVEDADTYLEERELGLDPGDAVILYTDGATEARDPTGAFFLLERLLPLATRAAQEADAQKIVEAVVEGIERFEGGAEAHDDLTVVALKRL